MPPLSRIRIAALLDLVEQQRYTPRRAVERQIDRAEALAAEIDPEIAYPEDWVVYRITGFRPDMREPRMIPGEALRSDVSALVERLSDQARLEREAVAPGALTLEELASRWSVSHKTIERYRRRGLVGRRVADGVGPTRLVFSRRAVEAFERANRPRIGGASEFSRLGAGERARIVRRAARYHARLGWTRNQIIGRLASRLGRSRETIRRALEPGEGHGDSGRGVPVAPRLRPDECRAIFEADRAGVGPGALARRYGRSRASIHRVVNARRCDLLRRLELAVPEGLGGEAMAGALEEPMAREGLGVEVVLDPAAWVEEARGARAEPAGVERARALAYHALRDRARRIGEGLARNNPSAMELDRAETDLRWATLLKRSLVHAERGLVLRTLEERVGGPLSAEPAWRVRALHRAAFGAVIATVDRYLPVRGGRLAAPVSLALGRALAREGEARAARRRDAGDAQLHDWTGDLGAWQAWLDPPTGLVPAGSLGEEAVRVVSARYGLGGGAPMTFEEIEDSPGVGRRRAVTLIRRALRAAAGGSG